MIRRPTYRRGCRCPVRGVLAAPPAPKPIGKGRFTSTFLARLLVEKFVHGRPTHRIAAALAHDGLDLADGTLAGVLACTEPKLDAATATCRFTFQQAQGRSRDGRTTALPDLDSNAVLAGAALLSKERADR